MKNKIEMIIITASVLLMILITAGCKFNVDDPIWDKPYDTPPSATITQITPANSADAGVNTITITGTNFADSLSDITVQFGNVTAVIESHSSTSITVRRPNISGDDLTVKINSFNSFLIAKHPHYKVANVFEKSNAFNDNLQLSGLAFDKSSNLFVTRLKSPFTLWKITPSGDKVMLIDTIPNKVPGSKTSISSDITDIRVFGNYLYLIRSNKTIERMNFADTIVTAWYAAKSSLKVGDFDSNGYLYAGGGPKAGLWIIKQDSTSTVDAAAYTNETVNALRVAKIGIDEYVYLSASSDNSNKIFRYKINPGGGSLGSQELVLDLSSTPYAARTVKSISIAGDGTVYIGTFSAEPLLRYTPDDGKIDILYKGMLPTYINQAIYDSGTNIYELSGNGTDPNWNLYKIDVGKKGAF